MRREVGEPIRQNSEVQKKGSDKQAVQERIQRDIEGYALQGSGQRSINVKEGNTTKEVNDNFLRIHNERNKKTTNDQKQISSLDLPGSVEYHKENQAKRFAGDGDGTDESSIYKGISQQKQQRDSAMDKNNQAPSQEEKDAIWEKIQKQGKETFLMDFPDDTPLEIGETPFKDERAKAKKNESAIPDNITDQILQMDKNNQAPSQEEKDAIWEKIQKQGKETFLMDFPDDTPLEIGETPFKDERARMKKNESAISKNITDQILQMEPDKINLSNLNEAFDSSNIQIEYPKKRVASKDIIARKTKDQRKDTTSSVYKRFEELYGDYSDEFYNILNNIRSNARVYKVKLKHGQKELIEKFISGEKLSPFEEWRCTEAANVEKIQRTLDEISPLTKQKADTSLGAHSEPNQSKPQALQDLLNFARREQRFLNNDSSEDLDKAISKLQDILSKKNLTE